MTILTVALSCRMLSDSGSYVEFVMWNLKVRNAIVEFLTNILHNYPDGRVSHGELRPL